MSAVTKEDVARLHAYLVVPIAVGDALLTRAPLEGDVQYGLHVALSEIDPDSALLAIALSAYRLAQDYTGHVPVAAALKMEADRIVQDYAPDWLAHYHNHPVGGEQLYELLSHVPEDLESIADLLESLQASVERDGTAAGELCSVLAIQARAHMDIAEYVLGALDAEAQEFMDNPDGVCRFTAPVLYADETPGDNIILFPMHRRR